jgi:PncC family amidohydrolase
MKKLFTNQNIYKKLRMLGDILKEKNLHLAIAESCTGGLVGYFITEIPGSSEYFNGSFVAYSNILKKRILKVPKTLLKKYSAVSKEVSIAMAKGAKKIGKADISIAITGIAGPLSIPQDKPVGLVYIAVCFTKHHIKVEEFHFEGDRSTIKMKSAIAAIDYLIKELKTKIN